MATNSSRQQKNQTTKNESNLGLKGDVRELHVKARRNLRKKRGNKTGQKKQNNNVP